MPATLGIVGTVAGIGGSLLAGDRARDEAYKGYHYLKEESPVGTQYVPQGGRANAAAGDLLGVGTDPHAFDNAFQNYQNSTGYQFQLKSGQDAITSSMASRGLLNSGATGKALVKYGQNLGSTTFDNYLKQLGGLSTQGLQGAGMIGTAGTTGGQTAAGAKYDSLGNAFGGIGSLIGSL